MFGIAGFASNRPEAWTSRTIERMVERLVHRGPDDKGALESDSVAIGMRRLSVIEIDHGRQPITTGVEQFYDRFHLNQKCKKEMMQQNFTSAHKAFGSKEWIKGFDSLWFTMI